MPMQCWADFDWIIHTNLLQNLIKVVPAYIPALPALVKCNLEGNPVERLDTAMTFTLTQFNLKSASEMVTEHWRHHEQVVTRMQ